jgi:hypothetical protein
MRSFPLIALLAACSGASTDEKRPPEAPVTTPPAADARISAEPGAPKDDPFISRLEAEISAEVLHPSMKPPKNPVACLQLSADGRVSKHELRSPSGRSDVDGMIERALAKVTRQRDANPAPPPTHLVGQWLCMELHP